ncbi:helix-turn-helix domain-containing protein [Brevibacillus fulvus]|uniref:Transcriptional regulator with XRE-family HTH domain n=1 Tax=Brevibacillus fulvus TaxID=1125967 RepID=A0A938Y1J1_9BACL|nr:helix-turn-helix transcriptional regulator [Brevibacillus fulvus]MBM7592224.1 transcriptional regulator with XRE-family HTH domain [Brevibacillus fulvus]
MDVQLIFSRRLRLLRKHSNVSTKVISDKIGVTVASWSLYETGKGFPKVEKLYEIAEFFNVSIDYLLGRTDNMNSHK